MYQLMTLQNYSQEMSRMIFFSSVAEHTKSSISQCYPGKVCPSFGLSGFPSQNIDNNATKPFWGDGGDWKYPDNKKGIYT